VYHLEKPHNIRIRYGHLGASPACRANAVSSMQLLRTVLQPAINNDLIEVLRKYISVSNAMSLALYLVYDSVYMLVTLQAFCRYNLIIMLSTTFFPLHEI